MFEFLVINGGQIKKIVEQNYERIIDLIAETYILHDNTSTINPNTYFLRIPQKPNARIAALPAYVGGSVNRIGIKWISSYPDNIKNDIPRASAILILNDYETGYPVACLEGSIISAARTAASAVLGAMKLNHDKKEVETISFIGNGIIAKYIFDYFVGSGWDFKKIILFDLDNENSIHLKKYINTKINIEAIVSPSLENACHESNLVVLATTSSTPYITDRQLFSHNPIILHISLRDLHPDIIMNAFNIVDDIDHSLKADTSLHITQKILKSSNFINGTIGEILNKRLTVPSEDTLRIFSPFGMGILDVALGDYIYKFTTQEDTVQYIDDFYFDQKRW